MMDLSVHLEAWHILVAAVSVAFHAGVMWLKVSQVQKALERIADDHETRLRHLERQRTKAPK